jgi:hypothetical protein
MAITNIDGSVTFTESEWAAIRTQLLELDRRDPGGYRHRLEVAVACAYRLLFEPETLTEAETVEELHEFKVMVGEPLAIKLRECRASGLFGGN